MKKYIYFLLFFLCFSKAYSNTEDKINFSKIEMDILRNDEIIGYSNYYFENYKNTLNVKNLTKFNIEVLGLNVFSISSEAIEIYENNKLISFKSNTIQNKKKKFVNLKYDRNLNKYLINGSSYKGEANLNNVIGNWWNYKILKTNSQISPLSGSIKKQKVVLLREEEIEINNKKFKTEVFNLKSIDESLPDDKKLNFNVWVDAKQRLIVKVQYERLGVWEYRIKKFE